MHIEILFTFIFILILFIYLYRYKIKYILNSKDNNFALLVSFVKIYLPNTYPYIKFDFSIIDKLKNEPNELKKEICLIEELVEQYCDKNISLKHSPTIDSKQLWETYIVNCKPIKERLPNDWQRRKEMLFHYEGGKCQRCGIHLKINDSYIHLRKPINKNGEYNIENLILCCNDCHLILDCDDTKKIISRIRLFDLLISKTTKPKFGLG